MGNGSWFIVHGNLLFVGYLFLLAHPNPPRREDLKTNAGRFYPFFTGSFASIASLINLTGALP